MIIDAHQHVWDPRRARYDWLTDAMAPINRPIGFDEVRPSLRAAGIDATVLVQAADNDGDTDHMLSVAAAHPDVAGVVAYLPLERPVEAEARLAELRRNRRVVGIRALIHDQPDPDWILRPDVDEGLSLLEREDVPFDYVAVLPHHLRNLPELSRRHPGLRIVVDHLAKPPIGRDDDQPWRDLIAAAAENPLVFAKVSGLYAATGDDAAWTPALLRPVIDHALEVFGTGRLMYGGDWPMSLLAGGYERVWLGVREALGSLSPTEREAVFGGTATGFYGLDLARATDRSNGETL